jgi:hypothetical protein
LANILVDGYRGGSFSISLATFVNLGFSFLVVGWREVSIVEVNANNLMHI